MSISLSSIWDFLSGTHLDEDAQNVVDEVQEVSEAINESNETELTSGGGATNQISENNNSLADLNNTSYAENNVTFPTINSDNNISTNNPTVLSCDKKIVKVFFAKKTADIMDLADTGEYTISETGALYTDNTTKRDDSIKRILDYYIAKPLGKDYNNDTTRQNLDDALANNDSLTYSKFGHDKTVRFDVYNEKTAETIVNHPITIGNNSRTNPLDVRKKKFTTIGNQLIHTIYEKYLNTNDSSHYDEKFFTKINLKKAITKKNYTSGEKIESITLSKLKYKYVAINEEKLGSETYLVAKTENFLGEDKNSVTFSIYEKDSDKKIYTESNKKLVFKDGDSEKTFIQATVKIDSDTNEQFAVAKVELRPLKDTEDNDEDNDENFEDWKSKFENEDTTADEIKDIFILKATSINYPDIDEVTILEENELKITSCHEIISKVLMTDAYANATTAHINEYYPVLNQALCLYNHTDLKSIAYFLGQTAAETLDLVYKEEGGSDTYLSQYQGRNGNIFTGDGIRFKGRGMIQLTGRTNYTKFQSYARKKIHKYSLLDITTSDENAQKLVDDLELNILASLWYWTQSKKSIKIQNQLSKNTTSIFWVSVYVNGWTVQTHPYYDTKIHPREPNHMEKRINATNVAKQALGVN